MEEVDDGGDVVDEEPFGGEFTEEDVPGVEAEAELEF